MKKNQQQLQRRSPVPADFWYRNGVKSMFRSRFKGGVLLNIDFRSLEIGISGVVSQDPGIIQILLNGDDYHSMTARNMWDIPANEKVPKDIRSRAKSASFGEKCAA